MKTFKQIDFILQVFLIAGSLFYSLLINDSFILAGCFTVGGWQWISCITHGLFKSKFYPARHRKHYLNTPGWIFITGVISIPVWLLYGLALLFVSPLMAIWYVSICYSENNTLRQKALVHLK